MIYESPTIRPPSEWRSGLLRITRGCHWNRCLFCGIYPHLGQADFSTRPFEDIVSDIHFLKQKRTDFSTIFLGDADPLHSDPEFILKILEKLQTILNPDRITAYGRFSTLRKLGVATLKQFREAGLSRIHAGLESGDDSILRFQKKGQSRKIVISASSLAKEAGLELSVYVLLGLGGKTHWQNHIRATAELLNTIEPDFIRIRRLHVYPGIQPDYPPCPLESKVNSGDFIEQSPEGTVLELKLLLDSLKEMKTHFTCDHANNFYNISGDLEESLNQMRHEVSEFLQLPEQSRKQHYSSITARI